MLILLTPKMYQLNVLRVQREMSSLKIRQLNLIIFIIISFQMTYLTFKWTERGGHTMEVRLFDQVDFICPYYDDNLKSDQKRFERYIIYQVDEKSYTTCHADGAVLILNCSSPFVKKRFTLLFETFLAIPNVPEFVAGGKYFFLSTPADANKNKSGHNSKEACRENMKIIVTVCCSTTTNTATITTTASTAVIITTASAAATITTATSTTTTFDFASNNAMYNKFKRTNASSLLLASYGKVLNQELLINHAIPALHPLHHPPTSLNPPLNCSSSDPFLNI
ncbi:hypothetical protein HELRODRAFT_194703 [Helobdella robusta]|uniref:Ephrin RBD domain-containing protein n=1 Tax=Helobdella robusta TaxID=6412 RepID=T1FWC1_HELRO|nr:hypothetical protein HELRODRAFT_194703 [Helobdella robusta]ESN89991.1 hypothetical protein HELRODRAFT_194703 [Helobdella robusta]